MRPEDDDSDEPTNRRFDLRAGLSGLADLLRKLDEAGERNSVGRVETPRSSLDYSLTIGTGPGRPNGPRRTDSGRSAARRPARTTDSHVISREDDGEFVVVADLPDVSVADLTVGMSDERTLVIAVGGELVEQVSLPWPARSERSSFNNGVLEVHLREAP